MFIGRGGRGRGSRAARYLKINSAGYRRQFRERAAMGLNAKFLLRALIQMVRLKLACRQHNDPPLIWPV